MTTQEILQGVHDWTNGKIVYDISVAHPDGQGNPTKYADLAAALGTNGANIPQNLRKGGMSVKYVQSSDNKYVQYRLMSDSWSTVITDWQGVEETPVDASKNLVNSGGIDKAINTKVSIAENGVVSLGDMILFGGEFGEVYANYLYDYYQSKYIVIKLKGTEFVRVEQPSEARLVFLKEFEYEPKLPYTLVFAEGESTKRNHNGLVPTDARYMLIKVRKSDGVDVYPTTCSIDGFDLTTDLISQLRNLQKSESLFSKAGLYIHYPDGGEIASALFRSTDYIPVTHGETVEITSHTGGNSTIAVCAFYDKEKNCIQSYSVNRNTNISTVSITVPNGVSFMRCSTSANYMSRTYINCSLLGNILSYSENILSELMHTVKNEDLTREDNTIYNQSTGVSGTNNEYEAVRLPVSEGDVLVVSSVIGTTSNYESVGFYNGNNESVGRELLGTHIDERLVVPQNAEYAICQGRKATASSNPDNIALRVNLYSKYKKALTDSTVKKYDVSVFEPGFGYYRKDNSNNLYFSAGYNISGYKVTVPIPVEVGDILETTTSITSLETIVNICLDVNKQPLQILAMSDGTATITQEMWNSGVRYVVFTFKGEDKKKVILKRNIKKPFVLDSSTKIKVSPYAGNGTINGFMVWVPNSISNGKYVGYKFVNHYKKWDSLEYTDAGGQTQTATNVVSADVYNNIEIFDSDMNHIAQGNTNFIYGVLNQNYTGDGHGNEVAYFSKFILNGVEQNANFMKDSIYNHRYIIQDISTFSCLWKSKVYKYGGGSASDAIYAEPSLDTSGNPIVNAIHYLYAKFEIGNTIDIENRLQIRKDDISFTMCAGAMLECDFGTFNSVSVNNDEYTTNSVSNSGGFTVNDGSSVDLGQTDGIAVKGNIGKMYGKNFSIEQSMEPRINADIVKCGIFAYKYVNRLKLYFMPVVTTRTTEAVGQPVDVFNTGDVISVKCHRKIEI